MEILDHFSQPFCLFWENEEQQEIYHRAGRARLVPGVCDSLCDSLYDSLVNVNGPWCLGSGARFHRVQRSRGECKHSQVSVSWEHK